MAYGSDIVYKLSHSFNNTEKWIILFTFTDEKVNGVLKEKFGMRILCNSQVNQTRIPIFHLPLKEKKFPYHLYPSITSLVKALSKKLRFSFHTSYASYQFIAFVT